MNKLFEDACDLIEKMASNAYQKPFERSTTPKVTSVHEVDAVTALAAKVELSSKKNR